MMRTCADVQWCPTLPDIFLAWGSDVNFFNTRTVCDPTSLKGYDNAYHSVIGENRISIPVRISKNFSCICSMSWCNSVNQDGARLFAVGHANGNISLSSFQEISENPSYLYDKEYVPRTNRRVNSLSWSSMNDTYQLLASLDKGSRESSLLVFDATRPTANLSSITRHDMSQRGIYELKPYQEFCPNESVHCALFSKNSQYIFTTTNNQFLKTIDCRDGKVCNKIVTKAVYGLCYDQFKDNRLSSFFDSQIHIWDLRQSNIPVVIQAQEKPIIKISWCPTRPGLLACLSRDSTFVSLFDLQDPGRENMEPNIFMREVADNSPVLTSSFSWHPQRYNTMLTVTARQDFAEHKMKERITLNWSPNGDFIYSGDGLHDETPENNVAILEEDVPRAQGRTVKKCKSFQFKGTIHRLKHENWSIENIMKSETDEITRDDLMNDMKNLRLSEESCERVSLVSRLMGDDISRLMALRAVAGYGYHCKDNLINNIYALKSVKCSDQKSVKSLCSVWQWLANSYKITKSKTYMMKDGSPYNFHGILSILSQASHKSDILNKSWIDLDTKETIRIFRSEERTLCLKLLSWLPLDCGVTNNITTAKLIQNSTMDVAIKEALSTKQFTRAAALSVFQLHLPRAIDILQSAGKQDKDNEAMLNAVSMAIAGFNGGGKTLWKKTCSQMRQTLVDPYLKAIFAFLTGDTDSYKPLLLSSELSVCDRLCFALTFLSDFSLVEFLNELVDHLSFLPNLDIQGIIITGFTEKGVHFLQQYIDRTSDVQTATLAIIHGYNNVNRSAFDSYSQARLEYWVESYYQYLCSQRLFHLKAKLVTLVPAIARDSTEHQVPYPRPNITQCCYYCVKPIAGLSLDPLAIGTKPNTVKQIVMRNKKNKFNSISCANCNKPLPQCALCLQHVGTASQSPSFQNKIQGHKASKQHATEDDNTPHHLYIPSETKKRMEAGEEGLNSSKDWFTWCQTCRHGGHANHYINWFLEHAECPVVECKCHCLSLDGLSSEVLK